MTEDRIIELRKATSGGLERWGDTLAFARAIEAEVRKECIAACEGVLLKESEADGRIAIRSCIEELERMQ